MLNASVPHPRINAMYAHHLHAMYAPRQPWVVMYDANGIPFWAIPQWVGPPVTAPTSLTKSASKSDGCDGDGSSDKNKNSYP